MSDDTINVETLLRQPEIQKVTNNINPELLERRAYCPPICDVFAGACTRIKEDGPYYFTIHQEAMKQLPHIINNTVQRVERVDTPDDTIDNTIKEAYTRQRHIGVVFSGGPAPGGHNVIAGLYDAAKKANPDTRIFGFLLGPEGVIENEAVEITGDLVDRYRNVGGFTMIKTGRTKIDTAQKMALSKETCKRLKLDSLVIIGGDDSNTNAAFLAEDLFEDGVQVIGVPKTIDGDIQVRDAEDRVLCPISFGFHSAARAFAKEVANLCTDCSSDVKYWHICKVMGRVASHLALEVALQTHANITLIGEDLADYIDNRRIDRANRNGITDYTAFGMTLRHLSRVICDGIVRRAAVGKNYGVIVIPEGILEFINEIQVFIIKLNGIIADYNRTHDTVFHSDFPLLEDRMEYLRRQARRSREDPSFTIWNTRDDELFNDLPEFFREGLLTERDSHGNFQFSKVETEKVLMGLVMDYLDYLKEEGLYKIGIERNYFEKTLKQGKLDPDYYGPVLFRDYTNGQLLMVRPSIFSVKTLQQALIKKGVLKKHDAIPAPVMKIYDKSVPKFSTQLHFYGYDGRGSDPTRFDCVYTYNLGLTVFSLIANGSTGQMAAIRNLEQGFSQWEPIGIPIAPLMHLEERKGKLELVLEKTIVDLNSVAYTVVKAFREEWLAADPGPDNYRNPGPIRFTGKSEEDRPITLVLNALASTQK